MPDNIERLIVRQLDGALGADEELTLNRGLIRNPQARRLREELQRIDAMASSAITGALGEAPTFDVESLPSRVEVRRPRAFPTRWLVPGAIAAGLLAWTLARGPFERSAHDRPSVMQVTRDASQPIVPRLGRTHYPGDLRHNASLARPSVKRGTGREVIGVVGDDGNLYWIEVDRTRTVRRPGGVRF